MPREDLMILGRETTEDGELVGPIGVPKSVWCRHLLVTGATGSGKTTTMTTGLTTAHQHTEGPTIVLDPKGEGWLQEIARAHYKQTGDLDDVLYYGLPETFPAFSIFDVRRDLNAGLSRSRAAQNLADRFLEVIEHAKPGGFDAIRSPDVIRYLIRALFDPVHGDDAWPIQELLDALYRLRENRVVPDVSDSALEKSLEHLSQTADQRFKSIVDGAITRVEKLALDTYLRPLFNHVVAQPTDAFAFDDWLNEDVFILIDVSGPSKRTQQLLANLVSTQLWHALQRRNVTSRYEEPPITLYCVDEIAYLRIDSLLKELLSMGREYGFGMIPMLQSPSQLDTEGESSANEGVDPYQELLNNCHSVISGAVTGDTEFVKKFASSAMSEAEVQNRLRNLAPSRLFFKPGASREYGSVKTQIVAEPPLPPGHPNGPAPLSPVQQEAFAAAFGECSDPSQVTDALRYTTNESDRAGTRSTGLTQQPPGAATSLLGQVRLTGGMTSLPLVETLPGNAMYEPDPGAVVCETCGANRSPTFSGLLDTLRCHGTLSDVDRSAIPPVELGLTLTSAEVDAAPISLRLLCTLQIIANIAHQRYDTREIDLVHDSPHKVLDLCGIDANDIQTLADKELIRIDNLQGYSYYTVTPAGRGLLREPHTKGVEWGHKRGDNTESLLHIAMVETLRRYVQHNHVEQADSPVVSVDPYFELQESAETYDLDDGTRFDIVGLDADNRIRLIGEAERKNNDAARAAVRDFDQIATVEPAEALWVVPTSKRGHDAALSPLADPPADMGQPRVRSYSDQTRIPTISGIDEPGMTDIFTLNELRKQLPEPELDAE